MQSYTQHNPRWGDLLHRAVTEPGIVSKAFSRFHQYSLGNQLLALVPAADEILKAGRTA
jgi:hypothetical protein